MTSLIPGDHSIRFFETTHARVAAFESRGDGLNILFLHGNSSCKEIFKKQYDVLAVEGHSVLVPDLPGHGDSDDAADPSTTYTFPGYADTISQVLDEAAWQKFIVVGWSLGGHIAMELVHSRPGCIGACIIGSPPGKPSPEAFAKAFYTTETTLLAGKRTFTPDDAATYVRSMLGSQEAPQFYLAKALRTDGRAREVMFSSALAGVGIDQSLVAASKERPLAVIHGCNEPFVRLDYLEGLSYGHLWQNRIVVIDGAGHAPHVEHPDLFQELLEGFLSYVTNH